MNKPTPALERVDAQIFFAKRGLRFRVLGAVAVILDPKTGETITVSGPGSLSVVVGRREDA
tara:strand:- start:3000 stop:3182 length:183 start_codon:yes stop_codon:yes gene_type:complete